MKPTLENQQSLVSVTYLAEHPVAARIELALRLHYCGMTVSKAAKMALISQRTLHAALRTPWGKSIQQQVAEELNEHFQRLHAKVIDALDESLDHPDPAIRLVAAKLWLNTQARSSSQAELSAEDVVSSLLNRLNAQSEPGSQPAIPSQIPSNLLEMEGEIDVCNSKNS